MGFSSEEYIEEILFEANKRGMRSHLIDEVRKVKDGGYKGRLSDVYEDLWRQIKSKNKIQ